MSLGLYISVPFCRTKCSYCNFASGVFSRDLFARYVDRLCADIARAPQTAAELGVELDREVDSIYLGGGTPAMLPSAELERLFGSIRQTFDVRPGAEVTAECAPGTLAPEVLNWIPRCGVNRVSLGVQSFVDAEAAAVGRLHSRRVALDDIARLRASGIGNINVDLIAGLPHQTAGSWRQSLDETITSGVPHVSVYMLEIDEDSRLGRELMAGGTRYHAHFVPDEDATADFYLEGCERLDAVGIHQYEISNFAHPGCESRHNLKYWTRQPYVGFGVDAHSMLYRLQAPGAGAPSKPRGPRDEPVLRVTGWKPAFGLGGDVPLTTDREPVPRAVPSKDRVLAPSLRSVIPSEDRAPGDRPGFGQSHARSESRDLLFSLRFSTPDSLDAYLAEAPLTVTPVSRTAAMEEAFFLGLRLTCGIDMREVQAEFGAKVAQFAEIIAQLCDSGLLERERERLRLTARGRLLSNEVFQRFLREPRQKAGAT